jgi:hypothetical protein
MTEQELLLDCLGRLNACGVPYLLTGSMAGNYWGMPRTTHELDFVLQLREESVAPFVQSLPTIIYSSKIKYVAPCGRRTNSTLSASARP